MGLDAKIERLLALQPDVAVVPECAAPDILRRKAGLFVPSAFEWVRGSLDHKGLAVLAWGRYQLHRLTDDPSIHYALPVRVTGPTQFTLLAIWAFNECPTNDPGPLLSAVNRYADVLDDGPAVVAGDFNNHFYFDRPGRACNHANALAEMNRRGMFSAYHRAANIEAGSEVDPTLYWMRHRDRAYHVDYCFLSRHWKDRLGKVEIGRADDWIGYSDHMPLVIELNPSPLGD